MPDQKKPKLEANSSPPTGIPATHEAGEHGEVPHGLDIPGRGMCSRQIRFGPGQMSLPAYLLQ